MMAANSTLLNSLFHITYPQEEKMATRIFNLHSGSHFSSANKGREDGYAVCKIFVEDSASLLEISEV